MKLAWDAVNEDIIQKSFRVCGITVNPDGSEDGEVICWELHRKCVEIEQRTAALEQGELEYSEDPFAGEDEEELEENELVVEDDS